MRRPLILAATLGALGISALTPAFGADAPVVATADQGFACQAGVVYASITVVSDDVIIDGCTFDGGGTTSAAVSNGAAGLSGLTIAHSTFQGYTGRTIALGFAEGVAQAADRASDVTITGNTLGDMAASNATSIAVFNTDGVTITDNTISNADQRFTGRRGVNLDSNSGVEMTGNAIALGASGPATPAFAAARWAVQVAMSDAPALDHRITGNTLSGSYDGVTVLSQRDVTGLSIVANDIAAVFGVRVNTGSATGTRTYSDVEVHGNRIDVRDFGTSPSGIRLHDGSTVAAPVAYEDVTITGNQVTGARQAVEVPAESPTLTLTNVKVRGNQLR